MPAGDVTGEMRPKGALAAVIGRQCEIGGAYVIVSLADDCTEPMYNLDLPGKSGEHQLRNQEVFYGKREQTDAGFWREAVRLALTSGRTRREIAEDLGIGLSTLTRWLGQERDVREPSEAPVDLHAELKRLRRENAVLKQERDILKEAAAFFAREGSR
jgi:transposase